jgi:hypothetical protein
MPLVEIIILPSIIASMGMNRKWKKKKNRLENFRFQTFFK